MSYLGSDAPASSGFGQAANSATMDSILLFIQLLRQDTQQIQTQNQDILSRIHAIESKVLHLSTGVGEAPGCNPVVGISHNQIVWRCPICGLVCCDAPSFKGHIRRLVKPSSRPRCHLNPGDDNHKILISRFGQESQIFHHRQQIFCVAFYGFVRVVISAKYDVNDSFTLITSWMAAAMSSHLAFPEVPGTSSSSACDDDDND
jgi:hypothetical protein